MRPKIPRTRLELAHPYGHYHLKVACLPFHHPGFKHANFNTFEGIYKNSLYQYYKCNIIFRYKISEHSSVG